MARSPRSPGSSTPPTESPAAGAAVQAPCPVTDTASATAHGQDAGVDLGLPLRGLFDALLARGARLSVRDYLDAVRALQAGHGWDATHGGPSPAALRRLVEALWARSDVERRLVARWFEAIRPLPATALQALVPVVAAADRRGHPAPAGAPATGDHDVGDDRLPADSGAEGAPVVGALGAPAGPGDAEVARVRVAFDTATGDGLALPRVLAAPAIADEYVLQPQTAVPLRELVVLWRRYRRASRQGPRTELDIAATVRERCRRGLLVQPELRPRRRNTARLLVLLDSSASMAPWQPLGAALEASLQASNLADSALRWFGNVPRASVHASPTLDAPEPLDALLRRFDGGGLLVVSDAGAARGLLNRRRLQQTGAFLSAAAAHCPRIVWLNPMAEARWAGTTAARLAADARLTMLPLDAEHCLRAVDILRGHKQ